MGIIVKIAVSALTVKIPNVIPIFFGIHVFRILWGVRGVRNYRQLYIGHTGSGWADQIDVTRIGIHKIEKMSLRAPVGVIHECGIMQELMFFKNPAKNHVPGIQCVIPV